MQQTICFYHSADLDGKASAAIVKYFIPNTELIPFDYNQEFPWDKIDSRIFVYMVDISLPTNDMYKLNKRCRLIYIDHHISKLKELDLTKFKGKQEDGKAACVLTWEYFSTNPVPLGIMLLGSYDVWNLYDDVLEYQYGARSLNLEPNDSYMWKTLIFDNDSIIPLITSGTDVLNYIKQTHKYIINKFGFKTNISNYTALALNTVESGSLIFESHPDYKNVDIFIVFGWSGESWKVSLYTIKDDIDVSKIAVQWSGGGHKSAAGFICNTLPFDINHHNHKDNNASRQNLK